MKNAAEGTNGAAQSAKPNQLATVSERKLQANRENAKKSTGPKTSRGKAYSRKNSLKHGLFLSDLDELMEEEDPREFDAFYRRLRDEREPVGPSEEGVVWQIAICWLRLQRLWRYENAEQQSNMACVSREAEDEGYRLAISRTRRAELSLLQSAEQEIETSGQISPESMEEIFQSASLRVLWPHYEASAEETAKKKRHELAIKIAENRKIPVSQAKRFLLRDPKSVPEYVRFVALETVREALRSVKEGCWNNFQQRLRCQYQQQSIPGNHGVDKIIRYGNTFERQLIRAYDWLERLQRRRKGEPVLPLVSVPLTQ